MSETIPFRRRYLMHRIDVSFLSQCVDPKWLDSHNVRWMIHIFDTQNNYYIFRHINKDFFMEMVRYAKVLQSRRFTFSPMASWMRMVSPDILSMTSPVFVSVSKNSMSCLSIVFKYKLRIREDCLSPVTIQFDTSTTYGTKWSSIKMTHLISTN